ncbi:MAG: hypothetical protein M3Z10_03965 [Gemmatimonadota bacterium]|nr:hypothetical protein [Gemmatimonadota bacterium]
MPKRNLLAFAIAVAFPLACNRKDGPSGDSAAAMAKGGADTSDTSDSQPPAAAAADDSVPVDVTIALSGGQAKDDGTYRASGKASLCEHVVAPGNRMPEWTIAHGGGGMGAGAADVELKVGKTPGGTTDQLFAQISVGRPDGLVSPHFISTFTGTVTSGSGTVKVVPQGAGARFDLNGVDAEGTKINATVICKKLSA